MPQKRWHSSVARKVKSWRWEKGVLTYTGLSRCPGAGRRAGKTQMAVWGQQQKLETEQSSMMLQLQIKVQETEERNREKGMGPQ